VSSYAVEESLKRLKTDWIDLYYLHRPDPATPIGETLRAFEDLIRQGKVRFAGCSNLSGSQLVGSIEIARAQELEPFAAAQDEYNLLSRGIETDLLPVIERHGMALVPCFPLASGLLTGKYRKGQPMPPGTRLSEQRFSTRFMTEKNVVVVEQLAVFCAERGRTMLRCQHHRWRDFAGAGAAECRRARMANDGGRDRRRRSNCRAIEIL
jgi:aryl-alcohol dehydrogenase-like predicted oxidoreductase